MHKDILGFDEIENELRSYAIEPGGHWRPKNCTAKNRVAIIIPYRDRENDLKIFLRHMHPFLIRQQLDYSIYLVEPEANIEFNRGLLMNIGFVQSLKISHSYWECFVFHDVDLIPEDNRNIYTCPKTPKHLSSGYSTFNYKMPYNDFFGGVTSFTKEQYENINGYSNLFFGWGAEGINSV
jgi:beta-1,4-galactosyltransferase 1